jgi:hypothetical protein
LLWPSWMAGSSPAMTAEIEAAFGVTHQSLIPALAAA